MGHNTRGIQNCSPPPPGATNPAKRGRRGARERGWTSKDYFEDALSWKLHTLPRHNKTAKSELSNVQIRVVNDVMRLSRKSYLSRQRNNYCLLLTRSISKMTRHGDKSAPRRCVQARSRGPTFSAVHHRGAAQNLSWGAENPQGRFDV